MLLRLNFKRFKHQLAWCDQVMVLMLCSVVDEEENEGDDHNSLHCQQKQEWCSHLGSSNRHVEDEPVLLEIKKSLEVISVVFGSCSVDNGIWVHAVVVYDRCDFLVLITFTRVVQIADHLHDGCGGTLHDTSWQEVNGSDQHSEE